jgi:pimeloyl-ACP methyl ester carboxylesterase
MRTSLLRAATTLFRTLPSARLTALLAVFGLLTVAEAVRADHLVFLKDGFTLRGQVRREGDLIVDPLTGAPLTIQKGFWMMDDGARRIIFSVRQVEEPESRDLGAGTDLITLGRSPTRLYSSRMEPIQEVVEATAFNEKWERSVKVQTEGGTVRETQRLTVLTPYFARVDALRHRWTSGYLTRELGPAVVGDLLASSPDLKGKDGKPDAAKRFRAYRFLVQAGWYDEARKELGQIQKEFPDQREKVESARELLQKLLAHQALDDIERAVKAGRHAWAQERLADFPREGADDKVLVRVQSLKGHYETINDSLKRAREYLERLPRLVNTLQRKPYEAAVTAILAEMHPDNVDRLEAFLSLARQAERDRQQGRTPAQGPDELLALAMTGWLLGNSSAEAKPEAAQRLWRARDFVLDYQQSHDAGERQKKRQAYLADNPVACDEMERLIGSLPPPEPPARLPTGHVQMKTNVPWGRAKGVDYLLQLPLEYHGGRPFPVLIVLHQAGEKPRDMLARWAEAARQHGYILVAPEWEQGVGGTYNHTPEEHAAVLEVIRDLRRLFQVDSDRVFLAGWGEGGLMAYDVGLSHPDQFAGVIPIGARPRYFARNYVSNAQNLPFYVVCGDLAGETSKVNRKHFEQWVARGYPALYVEYKGRGPEWFAGELPNYFDWMSRKKRARAVPDLAECQTFRPSDNRFYWVSTDSIDDRWTNDAADWNNRRSPATVQGRILPGNQIHLHTRGLKQLTVWLGSGMIDFGKPASVSINLAPRVGNRKVQPSIATLLEDFYLQGDRQRLFVARIDLDRI